MGVFSRPRGWVRKGDVPIEHRCTYLPVIMHSKSKEYCLIFFQLSKICHTAGDTSTANALVTCTEVETTRAPLVADPPAQGDGRDEAAQGQGAGHQEESDGDKERETEGEERQKNSTYCNHV